MKKDPAFVTIIFLITTLVMLSPVGCDKKEEPETVVDIDGNVYSTLPIGSQLWMVENLQVSRFRNGDTIATTDPATLDISLKQDPCYQWPYDGEENFVFSYGRLYTWYSVTDSRGVCPSGWHVPTDAELTILESFVGGMDITGNLSKFLGGYRDMDGIFDSIGSSGYWWSATESDGENAWMRSVNEEDRLINRNSSNKSFGFSVKCLQD